MQSRTALSDFAGRLQRIIQTRRTALPDPQFSELALELSALQRQLNEPYGKLCAVRGISHELQLQDWTKIPAVPTSAFKDLAMSCLPAKARTTVFHSSGTTQHRPSRHFHNPESLSVYEASVLAAFSQRSDVLNRPTIISLTPRREVAPNSSLVYMFETFRERLGNERSAFIGKLDHEGGWALDRKTARDTLRRAAESASPVLILGSAFLYVHLLDFLQKIDACFKLPPGSHVVETGGYKGRSRTIPKDELHQLICERFGISAANIICEYGMSESSSQAYDQPNLHQVGTRSTASHSSPATRIFHFPPWARTQIISPEAGREVNEGETGLIRICDLANVFSVMAIQTEDLGIRRGDGFELVGRAAVAEPRGCSLMAV